MKRLILVGPGASGKDYARKKLEEMGLKYCCSHTTRPKRKDEVDGHDYFFINEDEATTLIPQDFFYEWVRFNSWIYGTSNKEFTNSDLFIMTPSGIAKLKDQDRRESFIIYFDIDLETRKERLSARGDADTVERRLLADGRDFENFMDYDYKITDPNFVPSEHWLEIANIKLSVNG